MTGTILKVLLPTRVLASENISDSAIIVRQVNPLFFLFFFIFFFSCATAPSVENRKKAETHYKLGLSYFQTNKLNKAFVEFQNVIKVDPKHKEALNAIGLILISRKFQEYKQAVSYFRRAISIDPNYSEALNNLGVAYVRLGNWDMAIKNFKHALGNPLYPNPESAYSNLGYAFFKKGDYVKAADTLKKAIIRYPDFPQHFYVLGLVYIKLDKNNAAINEFNKAVNIAPKYVDAHWELANAYLREGDTEKAEKHFKTVSENTVNKEKSDEALKYLELLK